MTVRIALVGDFNPAVIAHRAIPAAIRLSAQRLGLEVTPEWIHTDAIDPMAHRVSGHAGIWCVPASPYANTAGALAAIRLARESMRPFLGTCGGFQHALLEYAQNVFGHREAAHAETDPAAIMPVIASLSCSLIEEKREIFLGEGTRLRDIYGTATTEERYNCNYGLNPEYAQLFAEPSILRIGATDAVGEVRAVELVGHTFFVATLFQPERSGLEGVEHPLITAFIAAAAESMANRPNTSSNGAGYGAV